MLTEAKVRNAKAQEKPYKLPDGGGLYLHVTRAGSRIWRWRYELNGTEKTLTIGHYPEIGLSDARIARDRAKSAKRSGRNPKSARQPTLRTFETVACEWHDRRKATWTPTHSNDVMTSLTRFVFKEIGSVAISEVQIPDVTAILETIQKIPAIETAHRVRQRMEAIFGYAMAQSYCRDNPAVIAKAVLRPVVKRRQPAITDLNEIRNVLRKAENVPAHPTTRLGLRLLALTAVRPGEIRGALRDEFDFDEAVWRIPASRMKMKRDHEVPLSRQAMATAMAAIGLIGRGQLVFPNTRHPHHPMSENAIGYLLNRAGYHHRHVPHGFRSTFSSVMNERYPADRAVIDLMLAHAPNSSVEAAYNRALHMGRRREIAQIWADLLLEGANELPMIVSMPRR